MCPVRTKLSVHAIGENVKDFPMDFLSEDPGFSSKIYDKRYTAHIFNLPAEWATLTSPALRLLLGLEDIDVFASRMFSAIRTTRMTYGLAAFGFKITDKEIQDFSR